MPRRKLRIAETAARAEAAIRFVIRNPGEDKNKISSKEHDAAAMVALLLHINYPKEISEAQAGRAFQPVKRVVVVRCLELSTRTYWQTPFEFVYDRESGSLDVDAVNSTRNDEVQQQRRLATADRRKNNLSLPISRLGCNDLRGLARSPAALKPNGAVHGMV